MTDDLHEEATAVVHSLDLVGKPFGNYRILSELGRGGMAIVYKADEQSLNRVVALKVLSPLISKDQAMVQRFQREAQAAAQLNHPNIIHVYAIGEEEGANYFTMEYIKGDSLKELRDTLGILPLDQAVGFVLQTAEALSEAHKAGVVHRDIKPSNIMIDQAGRVKVADFGIARVMEAKVELTCDGQFLGTPQYMSPEQCEGLEVDGRSDIYSLGVTFYELLAGRSPYEAETAASILVKITTGEWQPLGKVNASVPVPVQRVVERMMARDREKRCASANDVVEALRQVQADVPEARGTTTLGAAPSMPSVTMPTWLKWVGACLAVLLVLGGVLLANAWTRRRVQADALDPLSAASTAVEDETVAPKEARETATSVTARMATLAPTGAPGATVPAPDVPAPLDMVQASAAQTRAPPASATVSLDGSHVPPTTSAPDRRVEPSDLDESVSDLLTGPVTDGAVEALPAAAPTVPSPRSLMVSVSGDAATADPIAAAAQMAWRKAEYDVIDRDAAMHSPTTGAVRYQVIIKTSWLGSKPLRYMGRIEELVSISITGKVVDTTTGRLAAGPATVSADYAALTAQKKLQAGVDEITKVLLAEMAQD